MEEFFPKLATIFIVIEIIVLIASLISMILFRHKRIETYLHLSDDRLAKIIRADEKLVTYFKLMLWLSPVYLVILPLAIYYVLPEWTVYYTIIVILIFVTALVEYFYVKWILEQLRLRTQPTSPHSKDLQNLLP
jgi:hypothetical protein